VIPGHAVPSSEACKRPADPKLPTATTPALEAARPLTPNDVGAVTVQVWPSVDVTTVPASPAATKREPMMVIARRFCVVPASWYVHEKASADVRMRPPSPTAANI
jgi:hypothetical protein